MVSPELGSAGCVDLSMLEQAHQAVLELVNDSTRAEEAEQTTGGSPNSLCAKA